MPLLPQKMEPAEAKRSPFFLSAVIEPSFPADLREYHSKRREGRARLSAVRYRLSAVKKVIKINGAFAPKVLKLETVAQQPDPFSG